METTSGALRVEARKSALAGDVADRTERLKGVLASNIERMKGEMQAEIGHLSQVFAPRLEAYRALWALTQSTRFLEKAPISPEDRRGLASAMTDWYYSEGQGLFLSQQSTDHWLAARCALLDSTADDSLRPAFSLLRGQLKDDLGVYGPALKRKTDTGSKPNVRDDA